MNRKEEIGMNGSLRSENIPGTVFNIEKMDGATGGEFLDKVFYITNGIMLAQIREITGLDGTTLQNWVKRGWVSNPQKKSYDKEQVARILIICMMRDTMQLSRIAFLLQYINGSTEADRIVSESRLYDYICRVLGMVFDENSAGLNGLDGFIDEVTADYNEPVSGAARRLKNGISIIATTYYAAIIKSSADRTLDSLGAETKRRR